MVVILPVKLYKCLCLSPPSSLRVLSLLPERRPLFLRLLPLMNTRADIPTAAKAVVFSISLSHFPPLTPLWSALIRVLSDFV